MVQTICLNMIVKNEAHIITEILEKLTNKINKLIGKKKEQ